MMKNKNKKDKLKIALLKPRGDATPVRPTGPGGRPEPYPFGPAENFPKAKRKKSKNKYA
jgi:hypothetical protein